MIETLRCESCGTIFEREIRRGPKPKKCSAKCGRAYLTPEQRVASSRAANAARWSRRTAAERSAHAASLARLRYPSGHVPAAKRHRVERSCRFCGDAVKMAANQQSCGKSACRLARNAERNRKYAIARRAILAGAESEVFEPADIFERDGWVCGICGERVDQTLRWPDANSASLDHVIPLSRGGKHIPSNTRCSHLLCNTRRGNRFT